MFRKTVNVVALIADLLPGAALCAVGIAVIVGAQIGVLWY